MAKQQYYVLSRDFRDGIIELHKGIGADTQDEAWEIVEEEISTNMSQEWMLTKEEILKLKKLLEDIQ